MADEKKRESELDKARGLTEEQQAAKEYHEGEFQTTDPVTGEPRGRTMNWQDEDNPNAPIGEELSPEEVKARQKAELERSAETGAAAAKPAARPAAKKAAGRKRGR